MLTCLEKYCDDARVAQKLSPDAPCPRRGQISIKRFSSEEAKGPTWARAQDTDMLPDSAEFCLRTDSHMTFAQDRDTLKSSSGTMPKTNMLCYLPM